MAHPQVLAQRVHRQRTADQIGKPHRQELQRAEVVHPFKVADLIFDQAGAVLA